MQSYCNDNQLPLTKGVERRIVPVIVTQSTCSSWYNISPRSVQTTITNEPRHDFAPTSRAEPSPPLEGNEPSRDYIPQLGLVGSVRCKEKEFQHAGMLNPL